MKDKVVYSSKSAANVSGFPMQVIGGLTVPFFFDETKVREALELEARKEDIFVVTYPKCGTTWMRYIVWSIQNLGSTPLPSMEQLSYKIAPFLERAGSEAAIRLPSPRTLNVHFPFEYTPYHPQARYIYVARNPRDVTVSYWHFLSHFTRDVLGNPEYSKATFGQFFELFVEGKVPYGDYFDHLVSWYERKDDGNVLFLTYEQILANPQDVVLKVARFISTPAIDFEHILQQHNGAILKKVVQNTTFSNMKDMPVVIRSAASTACGDPMLATGVRVNFFRKGVVGDWINYFSEEQVKRLDKRMGGKVAGTGLEHLWLY